MSAPAPAVEALRRAFQARSPEDVPRSDCPDPDALWAAARGEASKEELATILDHLAICPLCTEAWRLAGELDAEETPADAAPVAFPHREVRHPSRSGWGSAWAAAALVVLAAGLTFLSPVFRTQPVYRAGDGAGIDALSPATQARDHITLSWTAVEGARYDLLVLTDDLRPVYETSGLEEPVVELPAEALDSLGGSVQLLYRVTAETPDGERRTSETFSIRLR